MDMETLHKNIGELEKYIELCYDEWSEAMQMVCALATSSAISDELSDMLAREIEANLTYVKENATFDLLTEN